MDQGSSAFSILAPVRQGAPPAQDGDGSLDDAVASLLSRPDPAAALGDDHDLLQLGVEFDAAHERWRDAVETAREPTERHDAVLAVVKSRGHLTMADHEAAEALPGFREATRAEEDALNVVADLSERALKMSAHSVQGLAVQARCLIPCVWPEGAFEEKAALGPHEDVDYEAVRLIIASCCAAAGVDWKGVPIGRGRADIFTPGGSITAPSPDLVALVAEWCRLMAIENDEHLDDEALDPICTARMALHGQICAFTATSIADLTAKLPLFRDEVVSTAPHNPEKPTLDYLSWCSIVRDLEALASNFGAGGIAAVDPVRISAVSPDPHAVLQAIWRHREAKEALEVAARAADTVEIRAKGGDVSEANLGILNAKVVAASKDHDQAYRDLLSTRPQHLTSLLLLLRHLSEHASDHNGIEDEPDVYGALIGAVEGIRCGGIIPPAGHDLTRLSIADLENLARIARQEHETLITVEQTSICYDRAKSELTPLGRVIELEGDRFSFLADHVFHEIARRRPADQQEADLRLETMVRHHLRCNGYIEPALLSEIVTAWGAR